MANVPRRMRPTQNERHRNVIRTHASLSGQGMTSAARPVQQRTSDATLYRPEPWTQTYAYPGALTVTTGTSRVYNETPRIMGIQQVRAAVNTSPAGAAVIVDVRINGSTIFFISNSDRPTITPGQNLAVVNVPPRTLFRPGDFITVDVAQVGSSTAGADLTVQIRAV